MDAAIEAALDRELFAFLKEELALQGDGPHGLYQWYRTRFIPAGVGLSPWDRAIASFVLENCAAADRFIEIGAGIGQACMLLALSRRRTLAIEQDKTNFAMMERAVERIADRINRELPNYMSGIRDWYPNRAAEYVTARSILCFPTLSWGLDAAKEAAMLDSLRAAAGVIVGLRYFFRPRETDEEEQQLVEQIRERGFAAPVEVFCSKKWADGFPPNRIVFFAKARE
jgi:hypothetical protein